MRRSARVVPAVGVGVAVIVALVAMAWPTMLADRRFYSDGGAIRMGRDEVVPRRVLWLPPEREAGTVDTPADEYEPCLSRDGQSMYLVRGRAGENADIFVCTREGAKWSEMLPLESINSPKDELGPHLLPDGSGLLFYSNREGGRGGYDLWLAPRNPDGWGTPVNLGDGVNTPFNEYNPAASPDGLLVYFASNRPRPGESPGRMAAPWPATIRERQSGHDYDLFVAALRGGEASEAEPIAALNTTANEGTPAVSPPGDFLYFSSDREGGVGGLDLYRARVLAGEVQDPAQVGEGLNTPYNELDPALHLGGFGIVFSSDRPRAEGVVAGDYNLFRSESREVFVDSVHRRIDWAGVWAQLWPWLLWVLLASVLLALLWLLRETLRNRRLSVLAKCLLGSGIVHLIILFLLSLWGVTNSIGEFLRKPGGSKVHLIAAEPGAGSVSSQIRGELTEADLSPPLVETEPSRPHMEYRSLAGPRVGAVDEPSRPALNAVPMSSRQHAQAAPLNAIAEAAPLEVSLAQPLAPVPRNDSEPATAARVPASPEVAPMPAIEAAVSTSGAEAQPLRMPEPELVASVAEAGSEPPASPVRVSVEEPCQPAGMQPVAPASAAPAAAAKEHVDPGPNPAVLSGSVPRTPGATLRLPQSTPDISREMPARPVVRMEANRLAASATGATDVDPRTPELATPEPLALSIELPAISTDLPRRTGPAVVEPIATVPTPAAPSVGLRLPETTSVGRSAMEPVQASEIESRTLLRPRASAHADSGSTVELSLMDSPAERRGADLPIPAESPDRARDGAGTPPATAAAPAGIDALPPAPVMDAALANPSMSRPARNEAVPERALDVKLLSEPAPSAAAPAMALAEPPAPAPIELKVPAETAPPESAYAQRAPQIRESVLERHGGDEETEAAVRRALAWLARHQSEDGHWDSNGFDDACGECDGPATVESDVAVTSLALLCFFGADHTHTREGEYKEATSNAIRWILARQGADGDLRSGESMYTHGIATIALAEAYGMTRDEALRDPVARAVAFIAAAKSSRGGWRYDPGQPGDTSVLGWQVMALVSAQRAGIEVPASALSAGGEWLDSVSGGREGIYSYQRAGPPSASMTAEALFCRQLLGDAPDRERTRASVEFLRQHPAKWGRRSTTYYWYYATLALFQHGGDDWDRWNASVKRELLQHQEKDGAAAGSWDPLDRWSLVGGRVYQTAICTLTLEVYYRYLPLYRRDEVAGR